MNVGVNAVNVDVEAQVWLLLRVMYVGKVSCLAENSGKMSGFRADIGPYVSV